MKNSLRIGLLLIPGLFFATNCLANTFAEQRLEQTFHNLQRCLASAVTDKAAENCIDAQQRFIKNHCDLATNSPQAENDCIQQLKQQTKRIAGEADTEQPKTAKSMCLGSYCPTG